MLMAWILFAFAAVAAVICFIVLTDTRKRLADAEAKLRDAEAALEAARKPAQPLAVGAHGVAVSVGTTTAEIVAAEKKAADATAEVRRLEAALQTADSHRIAEREKAEAAVTRAAQAEAKAAASDAMVAQARSKAVEAGHAGVQEAKKETDAVRAALADSEKRWQVAASAETSLRELQTAVESAQTEAANLREKLASAEAVSHDTTKSLRETFDARLRAAKEAFDAELQTRLDAEREQFAGKQAHLVAELEKAQSQAVPEIPVAEPMMPVRSRTRPVAAKPDDIESPVEKPVVILADADANALKTIGKHLEAGGYTVQSVATVAAAIAAARTSSPAALALDGANLPDGDCWQVLSVMKEDADLKEIPVLVFAPGKDKEKALEMGAVGCLAKPVDKAVLVATIKAAMVKRKQRARLAAVTGGSGTTRRSSLLTTPTQ